MSKRTSSLRKRAYTGLLLGCLLLSGCGKSGGAGGKSSDASSTSSGGGTAGAGGKGSADSGKVYTPDSKSKGGAGGSPSAGGGDAQSGGNAEALPSPADTTNGKPSAPSDAGSSDATKGQAVMNPGAPVAHAPKQP